MAHVRDAQGTTKYAGKTQQQCLTGMQELFYVHIPTIFSQGEVCIMEANLTT